MKKIFFGAVMMLLMASCSGNGTTKKASDDSARIADSIAQVEAAKAAAEQARLDSIRQDSIRQDSIAKAMTLQGNSAEVEKKIKEFYEGAVLSGCKRGKNIPWTKSALSKYCTKSFIKEMEESNPYDPDNGGGAIAVWILRNPDIYDSDPKDRVISVTVGDDDTVTVTYLDCGVKSRTRLYMKNDNGIWKINGYKFLG